MKKFNSLKELIELYEPCLNPIKTKNAILSIKNEGGCGALICSKNCPFLFKIKNEYRHLAEKKECEDELCAFIGMRKKARTPMEIFDALTKEYEEIYHTNKFKQEELEI